MANLSSFLTTSFHTQLSFLDADSEENLLEEEEEEEESFGPSGIHTDLHTAALESISPQKNICIHTLLKTRVFRPD